MTFVASGDSVLALLNLCQVDTPDGTFGFIMGVDGLFTDTNGVTYYGSAMAQLSDMQMALDGVAPEGSVTLSYFQDPEDPALINQIKELGVDYVDGREIRFYVQEIGDQAEFVAPVRAPFLCATRIMRKLTFSLAGAQDRSITVSFEGPFEDRAGARRLPLNTLGHKQLLGGVDNPSLSLMPTKEVQVNSLIV